VPSGATSSPSSRRTAITLSAVTTVLVILVVVLISNGSDGGPQNAAPGAARTTDSTTTHPAPAPVDPETKALAQLKALRVGDLPRVHPDGRYVVQLASKYPGITTPDEISPSGDHVFTAGEILTEHQSLRDQFGGQVFLALSTDYGKRQKVHGHALWVTFIDPGLSSLEDGESWCGASFPQLSGQALKNTCFPHTLQAP
jgi:serine/threonine-protein kinase